MHRSGKLCSFESEDDGKKAVEFVVSPIGLHLSGHKTPHADHLKAFW